MSVYRRARPSGIVMTVMARRLPQRIAMAPASFCSARRMRTHPCCESRDVT
ncbi:MAG: hypothetical protein RID91_04505 [Azospirillaceae bacterium]